MKVCAIVDAYSSGALLAPVFAEKGYKVIHVKSAGTVPALYTHSYRPDDFYAEVAALPIDEQVDLLRDYGVAFVIAGSESAVEHADELTAALKLPGNGREKSKARRNKYEMVDTIAKAGLKTAQQVKATDVSQALNFARSLSTYDVILKPQRSAATDLVCRAKNDREVTQAFERILSKNTFFGESNTEVCVQEFLVGDEYAVNTVSRDGKHVLTDMWRYHLTSANGVPYLYDHDEFLRHDNPLTPELQAYTFKVLDALDIKWGAAHTELMFTKDGPVIIEVGARLAGALPACVKDTLDIDPVELLVEAYTDPDAFQHAQQTPYMLDKHALLVSLISYENGTLDALPGYEDIQKLPSFRFAKLQAEIGEPISKTVDIPTSPGTVYLAHEDRSIVDQDYRAIRALEQKGLYKLAVC
jgi:biotin carboxylase